MEAKNKPGTNNNAYHVPDQKYDPVHSWPLISKELGSFKSPILALPLIRRRNS
ncbi:MAG: hypothetical protein GY874_17020 [Desulfobacteraceae bacterium]|nr:hypothetical protein [Desulfobacteraceae bacterium]